MSIAYFLSNFAEFDKMLLLYLCCVCSSIKITKSFSFYPRDAMLARVIAIATCLSVCLSVRLSVRPSRAGIVSKRRKLVA